MQAFPSPRTRLLGLALASVLSIAAAVQAAPSNNPPAAVPLTDRQKIVHVLNRFGYGPRPGDVERIQQMGLSRWFDLQLHPEAVADAAEPRVRQLRSLAMTPMQLYEMFPQKGQLKKMEEQGMMPPPNVGEPKDMLFELGDQKLERAVLSDRQVLEKMVDFWENHFNVNWTKGADKWLTTSYVQDTLRPHALGRFRDLLGAVAHSPAMMFYLDNWESTRNGFKPKSGKGGGLNENYARELMELHTLGVDGGYTQQDVIEVARCFTGWTIQRPSAKKEGIWVFNPRVHDDGQKVVMGTVIPPGGGEADGERVLDMLSRSPKTARFLAVKMCRAFVADDPPASLVDRVAQTYLRTDGSISDMLRTIEASPEFYAAYRQKIKTPLDLVASAMRAVNADPQDCADVQKMLAQMGMGLYLCEPPTGYKDRADVWVSSGGLLQRLNFCMALVENRVKGVVVDLRPMYSQTVSNTPNGVDQAINSLSATIVQGDVSPETRTTLRKAVTDSNADFSKLVGLLLGSPEFQRR